MELTLLLLLEEAVIKTIYTYYHTIDITILLIGAGQSGSDSYWSVGGGGGRTAIKLASGGADAVVAGGGGGGGACFSLSCSGISGAL
jgi:hypothetical protein